MKEWFYRLIGWIMVLEGFLLGGDLYSNRLAEGGFLHSGYSAADLILLFGAVLGILSLGSILLRRALRETFIKEVNELLKNEKWFIGLLITFGLLLYEAFQDFLFLRAEIDLVHYEGYQIFLIGHLSLLVWLFLGSIQVLLAAIVHRWELIKNWLVNLLKKKAFYVFVILAGLILIGSSLGIGDIFSSPQGQGFNKLNAPLLGIQVLIISLVLLLVTGLLNKLKERWTWMSVFKRDAVIMVLLVVITFSIWITIPIGEKTFTDLPQPPNYQFYPTSDSLYYEQGAYQFMVGNGIMANNHVGYPIYLAILHLIGGEGYEDILPLQIALISLIPMLLYKLTATLHTRFSGLVVSFLYIIRDSNAMRLGEHITLSNSAELMTEPLSAFGAILFSTLLIVWLQNPRKNQLLPLLSGGVMGWMVLIRVEVLAMIPMIGLIMLIYFRKDLKLWLRSIVLVGMGVVFLAGPWMIYSYTLTGSAQSMLLGEGHHLVKTIRDFQNENPNRKDQSELFPHHLANNLLQHVYYLPSNYQPLLTFASVPDLVRGNKVNTDMEGDNFSEKYLERYVRSLPYWWKGEWDGHLAPRSILPVLGSIALLVLGCSQIKKTKLWLAGLLGGLILTYAALYAAIGQSGGRFILIIDWISIVFYGLGLAWVLRKAAGYAGLGEPGDWWLNEEITAEADRKFRLYLSPVFISTSLLLFVIGLAHPLSVEWIPTRYTQEGLEERLSQVSLIEENLPAEGEQVVVYGKAIYPRFFEAGDHMADHRWGTVPESSYPRVEFYLVGTENTWAALPGEEGVEFFPHSVRF